MEAGVNWQLWIQHLLPNKWTFKRNHTMLALSGEEYFISMTLFLSSKTLIWARYVGSWKEVRAFCPLFKRDENISWPRNLKFLTNLHLFISWPGINFYLYWLVDLVLCHRCLGLHIYRSHLGTLPTESHSGLSSGFLSTSLTFCNELADEEDR